MSANCPFCRQGISVRQWPFPAFRHLDYRKIADSVILGECPGCGLIRDMSGYLERDTGYYASADYARSGQTRQVKRTQDGKVSTRCRIQAELIHARFGSEVDSVLDVGCNEGTFLREYALLNPDSRLCGYDINPHFREIFPQNLVFCDSLAEIADRFSLIMISHTLMYFEDPGQLIRQLKGLLSENGAIVIQCPDVLDNPLAVLMGDCRFHFSREILCNVMGLEGFSCEVIGEAEFPGEAMICAIAGGDASPVIARKERLPAIIGKIEAMKSDICARAGITHILGVTVNAAFAYHVGGRIIKGFVDENPEKIGQVFEGLPIVHPQALAGGERVLLPYPGRAEAIAKRLNGQYAAEFVAVC